MFNFIVSLSGTCTQAFIIFPSLSLSLSFFQDVRTTVSAEYKDVPNVNGE